MTAGARWYVVHTQPQSEVRADSNLCRQGFTTYLPRYKRIVSHARRRKTVERPLFPRYLFVALDIARDQWRSIQSTFGVSNLVVIGNEPAPLPVGVIETIRQREGGDGFVTLGLPGGIGSGSSIRLLDGIFAETTGVLDRISDGCRVAVLLNLLGREVRVLVPASSIGTV